MTPEERKGIEEFVQWVSYDKETSNNDWYILFELRNKYFKEMEKK